MFDFLSFVRDTGLTITVCPPPDGCLICLEVWDPKTGLCEKYGITDKEAKGCGNIDAYTGHVLDMMAARIGSRKAGMYANMHDSHMMREMEDFFRSREFFQQEAR